LKGACESCAGAAATLQMMVEDTLKSQVDERIKVIAV
jgi:Fe-S cluster biogenesis protein NfuA